MILGNFQVTSFAAGEGIKVECNADVSLLSLSGKLAGQKLKFLLDSGASCNFVALQQLSALNIDHDLVLT